MQQTDLLQDRFDWWVVKRSTSLFHRFAAMLQNKLHVFVARFTIALKGLYPEDTAF